MKPSQISELYPWNSVMQDSDCETVAQNIMAILARTGDTFRELTKEEYKAERQRDFEADNDAQEVCFEEIQVFNRVKDIAKSEKMAAGFCEDWAKALS